MAGPARRILIPTADYPPIEGGISTVALEVSRELAALGHDVTVIAPRFPGQDAFDTAEPVKVIRFRGYRLGWLRFFPMFLSTLAHARRADLVLGINVSYGGLMGLMFHALFGTPYLVFAYAYEFLKFENWRLVAGLLRVVYARAQKVVAISEFTRRNLVSFGVDPGQVITVLPGAPAAKQIDDGQVQSVRHRYVLDSARVILAVGRLIPRKGHVTLVRALPRILKRYPDTVLLVAGRGPCMFEITQEAHRLGVRNNVVLPGRVPDEDIPALYQACDVFALPTGVDTNGQVEGFGLAFVEAQAYGKPVVGGRSGGVVEAVLEEETGLLVDPVDADVLADAILRLFDDPTFARRLADRGRDRVESELNWSCFTRRMLDALEKSE